MNIHDLIPYQNIGLPDDILRRKLHGDFPGALRLIDKRLQDPNTGNTLAKCLQFHREIILRLPKDFPYTKAEALAIVQKDIPDYTMEELEERMDSRDIRWIYIDGEERIFLRFYSSMLKAVPGMAQRANAKLAGVESNTTPAENPLNPIIAKMKAQGSLSYKIRIRAEVKLKDDQFTPGMFIRAHLPFPADCPQQSEIKLEKMFPETGMVAPADAAQRTVCWEETMEENHPFSLEYSYINTARYVDAYNGKGQEGTYDFDLGEKAPHIVFTPYIKALCAELTEGITDPLMKARAFYDFITTKMRYTYMPDYFVMDNIAETCAREYNGDCGVFALLFITLCRCAGIPAQWQSSNTAEPDFIGSHDWARFYVAPYGWLFADPSYGIGANRQGCEERRQFYFGNLDPFRMIANRDFQENFTIPKEHWRYDPYDNQSGEMETLDRGFYGSQYTRDKEILLCQEITE
ncbi:MAG: transglutaminase domain-containing protein [Oscillospiraceae bacterium]|nr:transglutaminase domain-containing protein [Oscillospiraceae bacterium]